MAKRDDLFKVGEVWQSPRGTLYKVMPANELKQHAEALGISLSFDANFWNMGPCVIATFPTHNGGGCDSALAWMKNFSSRDDAESYALKVAIRNASPVDSAREVELG